LALLGLLASLFVIAGNRWVSRPISGVVTKSRSADASLPADYPRADAPVPAFQLIDQTGRVFDHARLAGKVTILAFVFAHCRAICPGLLHDVREAVRLSPGEGVRLMLVTLDPARDTPDSLSRIAQDWRLGSDEWLLSGAPEEVERLQGALGFPSQADPASGDIVHPPLVLVLDENGRQAYRLNGAPVAWIVEAVRRVRAGGAAAEKASAG
jgi:protein SCO1/2